MSVAKSAASYVYEGVWVDWSTNRGPVLGSILTVNPTTASILSPALAIFISIAGSQLWTLFQFAIHQIRATSRQRSLLFHQQQVVLRNTATDLNTIWRLLRIAIAWRHQKDARVLWTSLPLISGSLVHFGLIVFLGLFSSWLLEAGNNVLSRSPYCGTFSSSYMADLYNVNATDQARLAMEYQNYFNTRYSYVQQHVDMCKSDPDSCNTLPVEKLKWTSNIVKGVCPFGNDTCHPALAGSIAFDTGFLSSTSDLGFNANLKDRIGFRMTAQCAPMNDQKYATNWQDVPASSNLPARQMADVFYGPSLTSLRNATFSQTKQYMDCDQQAMTPAYSVSSFFSPPGGSTAAGTSTFDPIPELQSTNADTSLITLFFNDAYKEPVSDPWFSAQVPVNDTNAFCLQGTETLYTRDLPLTTMGCTQQWQICNSDSLGTLKNDQCTPQMGLEQVRAAVASNSSTTPFSVRQQATAGRILDSAEGASFFYVIYSLARSTSPPLQARKFITDTVGQQLPANQWEEETKYWVDILLASLQQTSLDYSTGQFAASTAYINITKDASSSPDATMQAANWLCQNQIIHSRTYRNFHFFALILTVVICLLTIILGLSIEDVIGYIRQRNLRYSGVNGKQDMWIANSDIEMLRAIDETRNGSTWGLSRNGIPVAPPGYTASVADLRADSHEVEKGTGIVINAVKRQQTGLSAATSRGPYKHAHTHFGHKRCATCSTFDLSTNSGNSSPRKSKSLKRAAAKTPTEDENATFVFNSGFKKGFERDFHPKLAVTETATPNTISSEVLPGMGSQSRTTSPQRRQRYDTLIMAPPLPISPLTATKPEREPFTFQNATPSKTSPTASHDQKPITPTIEITSVSPPPSHSEYSSASDTEREPSTSSTPRIATFPSPLNTSRRNRTQDMSQVYESPSSLTSIDMQNIHMQQPPSGWGVLPNRMSGLWNLSWNSNAQGPNRESFIR